MSESETPPVEPLNPTEGAENERAEKAHKIAEGLLQKKADSVQDKVERVDEPIDVSTLSPGERAIYAAVVLDRGFGDLYDTNGGTILFSAIDRDSDRLETRTIEGDEFTITGITGERIDENGNLIYTCKGENDQTAEVKASELIDSHLAKNAQAIGETFEDTKQGILVEWHTQDNEDLDVPLTDERLSKIEASQFEEATKTPEAAAEKPIDHVLKKQLERVAKKIAELKPTPREGEEAKKLTPHEERLYEEFTRLYDNLLLVTQADGPFGPLLQNIVLKQVNENQNIGSTTDVATFLKDPAWDTEVDNAARDFAGLLEDQGLDQEERDKAIENLKDPAGLDKLMQNKKLNDSGQEILRGFFGRDLADTEIDDIRNTLTDLLDGNIFDPVTKARIKKYGKGLGIIALIIAAIPTVALALTTAAAIGTPAALAGASGRR